MGHRTGLLGGVGAFALCLFPAHAHVELEQYLQQRVTAVVTPANIDLTIELLFTSPVSLVERQRIDTNGDGALSEGERRAYLEAVEARAEESVTLRIDGVPCVLTPLHDPELNFLDSKDIEAHPHVLRLFYFARTPESFGQGTTLTVDSRLWTDGPSLVASSVRGADGIQVQGSPNPGLKRPSEKSKSIRVLEATCVSKARDRRLEAGG